jgi:hypothetical protein
LQLAKTLVGKIHLPQETQGAIPASIRYRAQTIIDVMVRLTEAGCELRVHALTHAPARLRLRNGALRIASDIDPIDDIVPWIVLLLGLRRHRWRFGC